MTLWSLLSSSRYVLSVIMLLRALISIRRAVVLVLMVLRCILCVDVLHGGVETELGWIVGWRGLCIHTYLRDLLFVPIEPFLFLNLSEKDVLAP